MPTPVFRSSFAETIFQQKYTSAGCETWEKLARTIADEVCGGLLPRYEVDAIYRYIAEFKFIPGGRFLYYAGRNRKFWSNCFLLKAEEDTREDWANLVWKTTSALMIGGGVGVDYSVYRGRGNILRDTGGTASGPIPAMRMVNEIGRNVMQGGSRRSALYASLSHTHADVSEFLEVKNWDPEVRRLKELDFNFPAPLDCTNVSVSYGDAWGFDPHDPVFLKNVKQALKTGEPGFSFNFGAKGNETLRNACCEVTSEDDSDRCQLGSVNMARITCLEEFSDVSYLAAQFLLCSTIRCEYPYDKVRLVNEKNRRLGVGLMGLHEWMLQRNLNYAPSNELAIWLDTWKGSSDAGAQCGARELGVSTPVGVRAVAPTGTIGILAGTTTGIEPLFAVAYKRRYLKGNEWQYQYVVDSAAEDIIETLCVDPDKIETALDLANHVRRRLEVQVFVQSRTDQAISSTVNLPAWGSHGNNPDHVEPMAKLIAEFAPKLRGLTFYPDGARGGQPLTPVPYCEAKEKVGQVFTETHDICSITNRGGTCGV